MSRIDLADRADLDPADHDLLATLSATEGLPEEYHHLIAEPERNIYRAIARQQPLLEPFRAFGGAVWDHCGLDERRRELAILTVARAFNVGYEWHQHVRVALKAGLSPDEISAIGSRDADAFSDRDRALVEYVRAYVAQDMDDETFLTFVEEYGESTVVGVSILSGLYVVVALFGDALQLEPEEPFVGWQLSGL